MQITDMHLLASVESTLIGVNTQASLEAVLADAASLQPDLIIATGDIAQYPAFEVYQRFMQTVAERFTCKLLTIPGNHDLDQPMIRAGLACRTFSQGDWTLMGIDTHLDDEPGGIFPQSRLLDLKMQLEQAASSNIVVFGHHPAQLLDSLWLDRQQIDNAAALLEVLEQDGRVRAYVFGHAHQEVERAGPLQLLGAPSTCFQFTQSSDEFRISSEQPGYRLIRLKANGELTSKVFRLSGYELSLDLSQLAY